MKASEIRCFYFYFGTEIINVTALPHDNILSINTIFLHIKQDQTLETAK